MASWCQNEQWLCSHSSRSGLALTGDSVRETPFPPLNHDKMPSGVSQFNTSIFHRDCLMKRREWERETKLERAGKLIGSWLVRCKLLGLPQALSRTQSYWRSTGEVPNKLLNASSEENIEHFQQCMLHSLPRYLWVETTVKTGPRQDLEAEKGGKKGGR